MSDHADTIRRARNVSQGLAGEFASTDPSDTWTQAEVYEHVYDPLDKHLRLLVDLAETLLAERQQAIDAAEDAVSEIGEYSEGLAPNDLPGAVAWLIAEETKQQIERQQAIDALREIVANGHGEEIEAGCELCTVTRIARAALVSLGETE